MHMQTLPMLGGCIETWPEHVGAWKGVFARAFRMQPADEPGTFLGELLSWLDATLQNVSVTSLLGQPANSACWGSPGGTFASCIVLMVLKLL